MGVITTLAQRAPDGDSKATVWCGLERAAASIMPEAEVRFVVSYLFADDDGRQMARRIDRRVDRLPGLAGLGLVEGAVDRLAA